MSILENSVVRLRPLELSDLDFIYETENDSDLWEVSNTQTPFSKFILEEYIKNSKQDIYSSKQLRLVIENTGKNEPAGFIDLFEFDPFHFRAGVGIVIIKKERRKHLAENALALLINYSFSTLRLNQLWCQIATDNTVSLNLFKKAGFKITGKKEQWLNSDNGFKDVHFLQLLNV